MAFMQYVNLWRLTRVVAWLDKNYLIIRVHSYLEGHEAQNWHLELNKTQLLKRKYTENRRILTIQIKPESIWLVRVYFWMPWSPWDSSTNLWKRHLPRDDPSPTHFVSCIHHQHRCSPPSSVIWRIPSKGFWDILRFFRTPVDFTK